MPRVAVTAVAIRQAGALAVLAWVAGAWKHYNCPAIVAREACITDTPVAIQEIETLAVLTRTARARSQGRLTSLTWFPIQAKNKRAFNFHADK